MSVEAVSTEVSYQQPIRRELTHRAAVAEVFVTSLAARTAHRFVAGAQLPRMHAYYGDHPGVLAARHDLLAVMETARQAAIAIAHEFYSAPMDSAFMVRKFDGAGAPGPIWSTRPEPADLVIEVETTNLHSSAGAICGLEIVLEISCDAQLLATVDGSFSWVSPPEWAGLRTTARTRLGLGSAIGPVVAAGRTAVAEVGRENPRNVVIGPLGRAEGRATAPLAIDPAHPFLFDHELDHLSGSVLLEAARQTSVALLPAGYPANPHLIGVTSSFGRFTELDLPTECRAEVTSSSAGCAQVHCAIRQGEVITAELDLTFHDAAAHT